MHGFEDVTIFFVVNIGCKSEPNVLCFSKLTAIVVKKNDKRGNKMKVCDKPTKATVAVTVIAATVIGLIIIAFVIFIYRKYSTTQISLVSKEECVLCNGIGAEHYGEDNLGILFLESGELIYVGINRYNSTGQPVEKAAGFLSIDTIHAKDGSKTALTVNSDRGYARAGITKDADKGFYRKDSVWQVCSDCLKAESKDFSASNAYGIAILSFLNGEVTIPDRKVRGFLQGNYYVSLSTYEEEEEITTEVVMLYCPEKIMDDK